LRDFNNLNKYQQNFVDKLLPGRITLLLPLPEDLEMLPYFKKKGYTGVRHIDHSKMNDILRPYQNPISTTSINPSGQKPANNIDEILNYFKSEIDLILEAKQPPAREASTIIKLFDKNYKIIRKGAVPESEIDKLFN
jgi:tRNA threonylcarbamoyl adenosine modification protein (Sua5/YciO/YrdC/YwlC family)